MSAASLTARVSQQEPTANWLKITDDVFGKGSGGYYGLKLCKTMCQWISQFGQTLRLTEEQSTSVKKMGGRFGDAANCTIVTKFPYTLTDLQQSGRKYGALASQDGVEVRVLTDARDNLVKSIADTAGDTAKLAILFVNNTSVHIASEGADLVADSIELKIHGLEVLDLTKDLEAMDSKPVAEEAKVRLVEEKRYAMIKVGKAVASIVGGVMALGVMLFALPICATTMLTVSTASLTLALWSSFYKESMTHELRAKAVTLL